MELSSLSALPGRTALAQRVTSMIEMVDETVTSVRRIATDLRPLMLDDLGLNAAVDWLARESARRMGIEITLRLDPTDPPIGEAATIALYRMVQEALTNIARHAHATRARIEIVREGEELLVKVQDNGVGFAEQAIYRDRAHGLMGIRERAYMLGGTLEIGNLPGGGGGILVRLPLRLDGQAPAEVEPITGPGLL
jgi:signal transduction histidine kinase